MPTLFILFLIFLGVYTWKLKQVKSLSDNYIEQMMEKEQQASAVRKKSIESLLLHIDISHLPIWDKEPILEKERTIWTQQQKSIETAKLPMINLINQKNIDLKLQYGPANFQHLIDYESNFIRFLQYIIMWGNSLYEANYIEEAIQVLEYGVNIGSDLSKNYILLADLYQTNHDIKKLTDLLEKASNYSSPSMKKTIEYISILLNP